MILYKPHKHTFLQNYQTTPPTDKLNLFWKITYRLTDRSMTVGMPCVKQLIHTNHQPNFQVAWDPLPKSRAPALGKFGHLIWTISIDRLNQSWQSNMRNPGHLVWSQSFNQGNYDHQIWEIEVVRFGKSWPLDLGDLTPPI